MDKFEKALWLGDLPEHPAVHSAHRAANPDADSPLVAMDRVPKLEISASWSTQVISDRPPTTSSKLIALGALQGMELGERAKRVWHGLSRAVHHHAYELQLSVAEVRQLVGHVRALDAR